MSCAQTLLWVYLQQFGEKVLAFIGKMGRQFESTELITLAFLRERRLDHQHLVHQDSNTPTVYLVIIEASLSNFRADVIQSPTKCLPLPVSLDGPPKISDLQQISKADHILRLQIAMHDAVPMQIVDAIKYLYEVFGSFILIEWASPQYLLVKVMEAVLHNKKNLIPTDMVTISGQYVGMLAVEMYLHLFDEELQLDLIFLEGFECDDDMIDIGYCQNDLSSLTLAQLLKHLQFIPRLLAVLHVCHFLKCLVHVLQLFIDVEILLEVLVVQPHWYFVILEFLSDIIDIASTVDVALQDFLLQFVLVGCFFWRWGMRPILRAF